MDGGRVGTGRWPAVAVTFSSKSPVPPSLGRRVGEYAWPVIAAFEPPSRVRSGRGWRSSRYGRFAGRRAVLGRRGGERRDRADGGSCRREGRRRVEGRGSLCPASLGKPGALGEELRAIARTGSNCPARGTQGRVMVRRGPPLLPGRDGRGTAVLTAPGRLERWLPAGRRRRCSPRGRRGRRTATLTVEEWGGVRTRRGPRSASGRPFLAGPMRSLGASTAKR